MVGWLLCHGGAVVCCGVWVLGPGARLLQAAMLSLFGGDGTVNNDARGCMCAAVKHAGVGAEEHTVASPASCVVLVSCVISSGAAMRPNLCGMLVALGWINAQSGLPCAGTVKNGCTQLYKNTQLYTQVFSAHRQTCSCAHQVPVLEIGLNTCVINHKLLLQHTVARTPVRQTVTASDSIS